MSAGRDKFPARRVAPTTPQRNAFLNSDGAGDETIKSRAFSRRAALLAMAQAGAAGLLGARLYDVQVRDAHRYAPLADQNRMDVQVAPAVRGRILDRAGVVLADNEQIYRATLTPALARDIRGVLQRLARLLALPQGRTEQLMVRARRQSRTIPLVIASDLSFEQVAELNVLAPHLPGVRTEVAWRRRYHDGITMGHVVGYVGSADRAALVDPDPSLRLPAARVGRAGVELAAEQRLRGAAGSTRVEVDARGRLVRNLSRVEATAGIDVRLTIESGLQRRVLARLSQEVRGAVVALDVLSGEVLALASHPTFDPSAFAQPVSDAAWRRLAAIDSKPMLNRAVAGLYPPGSTFKMVTALAALQSGVVTPKDTLTCDGWYDLAGQSYRCWRRHGHGRVDLNRALAESCDVYFYEMANRAGIDALSDMAHHLGLGRVFDTDIALQKTGVVPDPEWKRARVGRGWLGGETILTGIGQGFVTTTPLQLAVMSARLATGRAVVPHVLLAPHGAVAEAPEPLRLDARWLDAVRRGMVACVNADGGTGANAQLAHGSHIVAGKTGTSQMGRASSDRRSSDVEWKDRDHALFVAFAPAAAPRYAVSVVIEHGGAGGAVAAPVARDVLEILFDDEANRAARHARPQAAPNAAPPESRG